MKKLPVRTPRPKPTYVASAPAPLDSSGNDPAMMYVVKLGLQRIEKPSFSKAEIAVVQSNS